MPATAMPWKGMWSHPMSSGSISGLYTRSSLIKFTSKIVLATGGEDGRKVRPPRRADRKLLQEPGQETVHGVRWAVP